MLQWRAGGFSLPALKVICPKCAKAQEVGGELPAGGMDHVCVHCGAIFRVRPPASRLADNLPVSRDVVPRPDDLPVSRDAVPRPGDLPVSRDAVPRPGDLPVSRDTVPRPEDLPVSRDKVPRPDDLPQSKSWARPGWLPGSDRNSSKTPPLGLALDLSLAAAQATGGGPPLSLDLDSSPAPVSTSGPPPSGLSLDFGGSADAPPVPSRAPAGPPRPPSTPLTAKGAGAAGAVLGRSGVTPPPIPVSARAPSGGAGPTLAPLTPTSAPSPALAPLAPTGAAAPESSPSGSKPSSGRVDLGFSLELEGDSGSPQTGAATLPFPGARVASEGLAEAAAAEHLPALQPVAGRAPMRGGALRPVAKKARVPKWAIAVGGAAVVAGAAAFFLLPSRKAPKADDVIAPMAAGLLNDTPAAYQAAESQLAQVIAPLLEEGDALRSKAAEITFLDVIVHGADASKTSRAEQFLQAIKPSPKPVAGFRRAKALLAVAKGKPREAEPALASESGLPDSQLVVALARMADGKAGAAVEPLRRYGTAHPKELVAQYMLARALAETGKPEARSEYEKVLSQNAAHYGAALGLARMAETPEKRLAAAQALLDRKQPAASPHEQAETNLLWGQAALEMGRSHDAETMLRKAISLDAGLMPAHLALGESLLYEGRYDEALTTLQVPGPAMEASAAGQFALGGAYLATKKTEQGARLINLAAAALPNDPRGAYWNGFAAATRQAPDLVGAEQNYNEALKRDPKFLPASLKLAALLQQQNKAQESLTVLRAAEEAGAPASILQLAWGDALIVAKEPVKAEEVFREALQADSKSAQARLGVAAALQAQDKLQEAKTYLEETLKEIPDILGLRERLAAVCLALGQKDEALVRYQEELKTGRVTPTLRLALARLALDLGKLELAQSEAKKVQDENPAQRRGCVPARPRARDARRIGGGPGRISAGSDVGKASGVQLRLRPGSFEGGKGARGLRRAGRGQQPARCPHGTRARIFPARRIGQGPGGLQGGRQDASRRGRAADFPGAVLRQDGTAT